MADNSKIERNSRLAVNNETCGIVVAGLSGGSGKSVIAVGIAAALARQGMRVMPFKKGPDYIDAGWLGLAAGQPCCNLDPYLLSREAILDSYFFHGCQADYVVVEGNRGLFDGVDLEGSCSTAELSVTLKLPVLLVVDCTKTTRTVAALVAGCQKFDRRIEIRGIVLNRIGSTRHESIVRRSIEHYTGIPVIGALPRSSRDVFPQRHLGITPGPEHAEAGEAIAVLAERANKYLDLEKLIKIMGHVRCPDDWQRKPLVINKKAGQAWGARIGVIKDAAFQFYYPENLEALVKAGAELVEINALTATELPPLDALYIGGGFPETSVQELSANRTFLESVRNRAEEGLPIYAECGGLIYLGRNLVMNDREYPLVGIFPVSFSLEKKPQAHGYTDLTVLSANPFYQVGTEISGHEFRYSKIIDWQGLREELVCKMNRGVGFAEKGDGLLYKNVFAIYTHVHALGTPEWAKGMVAAARKYNEEKT